MAALCLAGADLAAAGQDDLRGGLLAEYFNIDEEIQDFPALAPDRKPEVRRIEKQVNYESTDGKFAETDMADCFYVRWKGVVRVPKDGKYVFYTESDDGSRLWINGKQVVDNPGCHAMEEKSGEVELKAGDHEIKIDLFENMGGAGIKVSWETEGLAKEIIPEKALFHPKDKELDK